MRRGVFVAGTVVLVLGVLIGLVSRTVDGHFTEANFTPASPGTWEFSPILNLQAGLNIQMTWVSTRGLTFGIATAFEAANYRFNLTSELKLVASASGRNATLSVVLPGSTSYQLALKWDEGQGPIQISIDLHATQPSAYALYAFLVGGTGFALLIYGLATTRTVVSAAKGPGGP